MEVDTPGFLNLLQLHLAWYPRLQVQDAYKLLYQGIMGPEHIMPTQQEFTRQLEAEFEILSPKSGLQLLEPIRADESLFRLNLRAYKSIHPTIEPLITLFLDTSRLITGSHADLVHSWGMFFSLCIEGRFENFSIPQVKRFSAWLEREDYPPVHHSVVYRRAYVPAYRLIAAPFIPSLEVIDAG